MRTSSRLSIPVVLALASILACYGGDSGNPDPPATDAGMTSAAEESTPSNPRFGVWQMETDRPPPYRNVMTYEPWGDGGMRITVATTNNEGETSEWSYETLFDGEFRPVSGQESATTAVEVVDEYTNRILNARDGEVRQIIVNVLSEDGNTINNEYRRIDEDGTEQEPTYVVYRRIE